MPSFQSPYPPITLPARSYFSYVTSFDPSFPENAPVCIDGLSGETFSREAYRTRALALAAGLRNADAAELLPLNRGSTVTIFSPNTLLYTVIIAALGAAGIRGAFCHAGDVHTELAHAYRGSQSSHILVHVSLLSKAVDALAHLGCSPADAKRRIVVLSHRAEIPPAVAAAGWVTVDDLPTAPVRGVPEAFDGARAHETALIYFSSGTTGGGFKPVELTHYNVTSVLAQTAARWPYYDARRDVVLSVLPLCGVFGGIILVLFSYLNGVPYVILPRFDPVQWLSCIPKFQVTVTMLPPSLVAFLATHPLVDTFDLASLRLLVVGAAPTPPALYDRVLERLARRGVRPQICETYGMTETSAPLAFLPCEAFARLKGSVGPLIPNVEGRIVNEDGEDVRDTHRPGELWVRGPNIMKGYAGDAEANKQTFTSDGWYRTGDIVTRDAEGNLTVVGRLKEFIKYNGWQAPPADVEAVLAAHPDVADAGVIGVFSEKEVTELPRAYVVPRDSKVLEREGVEQFTNGLQDWVRNRVANYKLLRGGIFVTSTIPRNSTGKILRRDLRKLAEAKL